MYTLRWKNPAIDVGKSQNITVPVGQIVTNKASISFTGKGAANYGTTQQENLMRLLENFADTTSPAYPTVGQLWYDSKETLLRMCTSTAPLNWRSLGGIQITNVGDTVTNPSLGDFWFQRTGLASGYLYVYTGVGRYPNTGTTIGGWEQIWPVPVFTGAREEYDAMLVLVNRLIGPTSGSLGNAAIGKSITNLTNLPALDTNMRSRYNALAGGDVNVVFPASDGALLRVEPNSNDWDTLLAAAKYALNRLDLPASFLTDISPNPFVTDGRKPPDSLTALPTTDLRYPSAGRRANHVMGSITLHRQYTETMNALLASMPYAYSIQGVNGSNGTYPDFNTTPGTTVYTPLCKFDGPAGGATSVTFSFNLNFPNATDRLTWMNSGGGIDILLSHVGGGNAADNDMRSLVEPRGFIRMTRDKVRTFGSSRPLTMAIAPITTGMSSVSGSLRTMSTQTVGTTKYVVQMISSSATTFTITVTVTPSAAIVGTFGITTAVFYDDEKYSASGASTPVFGKPLQWTAADKVSGSAFLVSRTPVLP